MMDVLQKMTSFKNSQQKIKDICLDGSEKDNFHSQNSAGVSFLIPTKLTARRNEDWRQVLHSMYHIRTKSYKVLLGYVRRFEVFQGIGGLFDAWKISSAAEG